MAETIKQESRENGEGPRFHVEYSQSDPYNIYKFKEAIDSLDIKNPEEGKGVTKFDGTFETPYGNFGFEGEISKAQKMIANLKELVRLSDKQKEISKNLEDLRSRQRISQTQDRFDEWRDTSEKIDKLNMGFRTNELRISNLNEKLKPYKM